MQTNLISSQLSILGMKNAYFQKILLTFFFFYPYKTILSPFLYFLFYFYIALCVCVRVCLTYNSRNRIWGKFFFFFLSFLFLFLVKCKSTNLIRMRHYTKFFPIPRGERTRKGKATPTEKWGRVRIFEKIRETHCVGGPTIVLGPTGSMIKLENQLHGLRRALNCGGGI